MSINPILSVKSDYTYKNEYQWVATQRKNSQNGNECLQINIDNHKSLLARKKSSVNRGEMRVKTDNVLAVTGDYTYKENTKREAWLRRNLYVDYVQTMEEALNMLLDKDYVLIVVNADTVENLQLLRVMHDLKPIPILVYSYTEPSGNVEPLKMGAHVYIVSPCSLDFIIESGYALSQLYPRTDGGYSTKQPEFLTHEYIRVCVESRQVFVKGKLVDLKKKEFEVLCLLMQNKGKVLKYAEIFRQAWGEEYVDNTVNNLGAVIYRIKRELKKVEPATKDYIKNIHQIGYSFDP